MSGPRVARCGTRSGAARHARLGEPLCDPCREARNAYRRDHYRRSGHRTREQNAARSKALWRLARRHPDEFNDLFIEERLRQRSAKEETSR